jgi:hypothetical protein
MHHVYIVRNQAKAPEGRLIIRRKNFLKSKQQFNDAEGIASTAFAKELKHHQRHLLPRSRFH